MCDPFGKDIPLYTYRTTCNEDKNLQDDRTMKLFYNVSAYKKIKDAGIRAIFEYIATGKVTSEYVKRLDKQVQQAKTNAENRRTYITFEMKLRERENEGKTIGEENTLTRVTALFNLLKEQNRMADFERAMTDKTYLKHPLSSMNQ